MATYKRVRPEDVQVGDSLKIAAREVILDSSEALTVIYADKTKNDLLYLVAESTETGKVSAWSRIYGHKVYDWAGPRHHNYRNAYRKVTERFKVESIVVNGLRAYGVVDDFTGCRSAIFYDDYYYYDPEVEAKALCERLNNND